MPNTNTLEKPPVINPTEADDFWAEQDPDNPPTEWIDAMLADKGHEQVDAEVVAANFDPNYPKGQ